MRAGKTPVFDNERERAIYDLAAIAMAPGAGSDEVFNRAERLLGRNGIAEVLGLLGYYSSVSMGMKLHRVPVRCRRRCDGDATQLQPHFDTARRHQLLGLLHGEFAVVKDARREHCVGVAERYAVGEMFEIADTAAGDDQIGRAHV